MAESYSDCRAVSGITVGLIDGIISIARVLRIRDLGSDKCVIDALEDLQMDEDVKWLLSKIDLKSLG